MPAANNVTTLHLALRIGPIFVRRLSTMCLRLTRRTNSGYHIIDNLSIADFHYKSVAEVERQFRERYFPTDKRATTDAYVRDISVQIARG